MSKARCFSTFFLFSLVSILSYGQTFKTHQVVPIDSLQFYLKEDIQKELKLKKGNSKTILASYFRKEFETRFFYDWTSFEQRFKDYNSLYGRQKDHALRAADHMEKYNGATVWKLPFDYLNGEPVNAYALRHLARQHKMVDVGFQYYYDQKDVKYIDYFTNQMQSLNEALHAGKYEKIADGNGVYEAFRSGYRVLNWLQLHGMFLGETAYGDKDQLITITTLLQHGAHLYDKNDKYHPGNHQTRGVSALAMIAILLRDFKGTDLWLQRALQRLEEHLDKEINDDGFQFERSVHYHMSDIANYFYVYQLAKINNINIGETWEQKLKSLFTTLSKIAYPDKTAPVLQDDTEIPWADKNDISGAMTLGYMLFEDATLGYFAKSSVSHDKYWFLQQRQLNLLDSITTKKPDYKSLAFEDTGYYIMREDWDYNDKMMIISNGLDKDKPDHQHGDMLGVQAYANGKAILPNYQVRYPLTDFYFFKNSMVKNVALVDNELQGKQWTGNKGGSGFGKFRELPEPSTIAWKTSPEFDFYTGSHDGFKNVDVTYSRQIIYIKDDFWVVRDNFSSPKPHTFKQVWQGHYSLEEEPNLLRATFDDASGFDIFQLNKVDSVLNDGRRGKQWSIVSKSNKNEFSFITVLFPYQGNANRIDETMESPTLKGWRLNSLPFKAMGEELKSLTKENTSYLFNIKELTISNTTFTFDQLADVRIEKTTLGITLHSLSGKTLVLAVSGSARKSVILKPGEDFLYPLD